MLNNGQVDLAIAIGSCPCLGNYEPRPVLGGLLRDRKEHASIMGRHTHEPPESKPPTRVAIYTRFSSEMQSPSSIDDQIRECKEYAERSEWEVVLVESDAAVCAGAVARRAGYQRVMEAGRAGAFDILLVDEMTRFSRDFFVGLSGVAELHRLGVKLADRRHGLIDVGSPVGQILLAIGFSQGEDETRKLGERSKRGQRGKVLRRYSAGGEPPYGYRRVPEYSSEDLDVDGRPTRMGVRWEPDPAQAPVVLKIFRSFDRGDSKTAIARSLNQQGVPTRRAGQYRAGRKNSGTWAAASMTRLLENEIYIGRRTWNRTSRTGPKHPISGKKKQQPNPREEWDVVEDPDLAIVPKELWNRVQRRLAQVAKQYAKTRTANVGRKYLLSGLIRCAACGHNFVVGTKKRGIVQYQCSFVRRGVCSNSTLVPLEALETKIRTVLDAVAKDPDHLRALVSQHNRLVAEANEDRMGELRRVEAQRAQCEVERDRFVEAIARAQGTPDILVKEIEKREQRIVKLDEQIKRFQLRLQPLLLPQVEAVRDYVVGHQSLFRGDLSEDKAFLEGVLDGIFVHADGALVLAFREDGLFGPVASYELTSEESLEAPLAALGDRRRVHAELLRDTREWAGPNTRLKIQEAEGFVLAKSSAPMNPVEKTVGVPTEV